MWDASYRARHVGAAMKRQPRIPYPGSYFSREEVIAMHKPKKPPKLTPEQAMKLFKNGGNSKRQQLIYALLLEILKKLK